MSRERIRNRGYQFDPAAFERALTVRGLHGRAGQLAKAAHVSPATLSRARQGGVVDRSTATRIATALEEIPVLETLESLLVKEAV